ncbi:MAG: phospholipid/cholesterol/gamma-HCH transport system substrate-binding protein [Nocardioidaceae bacterium]|jgi:virulence factor Mce-like protein|nr:phospholipid/cholesterol/gamma-HCH transport system substrate-binding protein [Nocardioidaceae bacterium]
MSISGLAQRFAGLSKLLVAVVVLLLLAALFLVVNNKDDKRYVTVDFQQTNSVYKGSDVKVLGVPVGKVDKLTPRGNVVRVRISYDSKYRLPSNVKAVVVSPSIVGDRFVQLAPAYNGGAALKNNAFIPVSRTAVPVELDKIYQSLDDLSLALGPKGANKEGALSNVIDDTAKQLDGQGAQLNKTLHNFGKLSTTLSNNKEELFGSLREVNDFVTLLKTNDATVRNFNDSTAKVSTVLAGERKDLGATLKALSLALVDVNTLVKENRGELKGNISNIASLAKVLAKHEQDLKDITVAAPTALTNIALAYNGNTGTLDTRLDMPEALTSALKNPASLVCNLLGDTTLNSDGLCATLTKLLPDLTTLPRSAAASSITPDRVSSSLSDMLAVK